MLERLRDATATTPPSQVLHELIQEVGYIEYVRAQQDRNNDDSDDEEQPSAATDLELVGQVRLCLASLTLSRSPLRACAYPPILPHIATTLLVEVCSSCVLRPPRGVPHALMPLLHRVAALWSQDSRLLSAGPNPL
jgi:hypothetical protein